MARFLVVHGSKTNPVPYEVKGGKMFLSSDNHSAWESAGKIKRHLEALAFHEKEPVGFWGSEYKHTEESLIYQRAADSIRVIEIKLSEI
jgi:hypothetical protein